MFPGIKVTSFPGDSGTGLRSGLLGGRGRRAPSEQELGLHGNHNFANQGRHRRCAFPPGRRAGLSQVSIRPSCLGMLMAVGRGRAGGSWSIPAAGNSLPKAITSSGVPRLQQDLLWGTSKRSTGPGRLPEHRGDSLWALFIPPQTSSSVSHQKQINKWHSVGTASLPGPGFGATLHSRVDLRCRLGLPD